MQLLLLSAKESWMRRMASCWRMRLTVVWWEGREATSGSRTVRYGIEGIRPVLLAAVNKGTQKEIAYGLRCILTYLLLVRVVLIAVSWRIITWQWQLIRWIDAGFYSNRLRDINKTINNYRVLRTSWSPHELIHADPHSVVYPSYYLKVDAKYPSIPFTSNIRTVLLWRSTGLKIYYSFFSFSLGLLLTTCPSIVLYRIAYYHGSIFDTKIYSPRYLGRGCYPSFL